MNKILLVLIISALLFVGIVSGQYYPNGYMDNYGPYQGSYYTPGWNYYTQYNWGYGSMFPSFGYGPGQFVAMGYNQQYYGPYGYY